MPKRKLLNVRSVLERIIVLHADMYERKIDIPPAYQDELRQIAFLAVNILRKRDATATRKDLYVESKAQ